MITKEAVASIWRIYPSDVTIEQAIAHEADFTGVCVICHLTGTKIFVKGMLADLGLTAKREFVQACADDGIEIIQMERAKNRTLPFSRRIDDHFEIKVSDLQTHLSRHDVVTERRRIRI